MKQEDTYLTITGISSGSYKEKGSRFLSFAYPVQNENAIKPILNALRKTHVGARHFCYAYQIGIDNKVTYSNDDGEPSGTAGKPILGQIYSNQLTNVLIVVVRYFGGVLLGTGGLIQAYRAASADVISKSSLVNKFIISTYLVKFNHLNLHLVMNVIKDCNLETSDQQFDMDCQIKIKIKKRDTEAVRSRLSVIPQVNVHFISIE